MPDEIRIDGGGGLSETEERLAKLAALVDDLRLFWPLVVPLYVRWMGEQFDQEGGFWTEHWQELSPDYLAWKTEHYPGKGILTAEGDLRHAAQSPTRKALPHELFLTVEPFVKARGPSKGRRIDPDWFQSGTNTMPARPLIPEILPGGLQVEVDAVADEYIQDACRRLGLAV